MQKTLSAVIVLCLLMAFRMVSYAASPAVDGFVGVPWGASRQQVISVMAEKGFTLMQQKDLGGFDKYLGTFADYPAELVFYYSHDVFCSGKAELMVAKNRGMDVAMKYYYEVVELVTAKYGEPTKKSYAFLPGPGGKETILNWHSIWENIPSAIIPPGPVRISVLGGDIVGYKVQVIYSYDSVWARLKNAKDI